MIKPILNLFFPLLCCACKENQPSHKQPICIHCLHELPRTNLYGVNSNLLEKRFWGRVNFERVSSFLFFENKGKVQRIIHQFKYKGNTNLAVFLGEWAAAELLPLGFFEGIDAIVPVPIHQRKRKSRGYNQSDYIAKGLANSTHIDCSMDAVKKELHTESQTKKSRFRRWKNVSSSFELGNVEGLENKHVLLVDDVMTTGATAEACARVLLKIKGLRLSFLCMAIPF